MGSAVTPWACNGDIGGKCLSDAGMCDLLRANYKRLQTKCHESG